MYYMQMIRLLKFFLSVLTVVLVAGNNVLGQQRVLLSQYIFDGLVLNPAYAGSHVQLSTTLTYRDQWINFDGAPKTQMLSTHVGLLDNKMGLGLLVANDQIGVHEEFSMYGSYAYKIKFPTGGILSMGLQAGFSNRTSNFNTLNLSSPNDPVFAGRITKLSPNFGTGLYYYEKDFFVGFSVPFILSNRILQDFENSISEITENRNYYLWGGMMLYLNRDESLKLKPSALIRAQDGAPVNFDFTLDFILYDVISIGSSYRNIEGVITYINLKIVDNLHLGYGYDWTQSDLNQFSNGTHEFMLNYRVRLRGVHKPVECPSYYSIK